MIRYALSHVVPSVPLLFVLFVDWDLWNKSYIVNLTWQTITLAAILNLFVVLFSICISRMYLRHTDHPVNQGILVGIGIVAITFAVSLLSNEFIEDEHPSIWKRNEELLAVVIFSFAGALFTSNDNFGEFAQRFVGTLSALITGTCLMAYINIDERNGPSYVLLYNSFFLGVSLVFLILMK